MKPHLWLRAEHKPYEKRTPLTPEDAGSLIDAGIRVTVESSDQRIFSDHAYERRGCRLVADGSWRQAPTDAYILGLKELRAESTPLKHRHIYFGHAFKEQAGWRQLLSRFAAGGGSLFDLEYLVDEDGRRVAAFGYWAGHVGAALGTDLWCHQLIGGSTAKYPPARPFTDRSALIRRLERRLEQAREADGYHAPTALVIGALGRCGTGARELFDEIGVAVTGWDMAETAAGGPFAEILDFDILVNAVLLAGSLPPFLTRELIDLPTRRLSVIADVSCDPTSPNNPLPIYERITDLDDPAHRIVDGQGELPVPLDLIAIDHLPTILPRESSIAFSRSLLPHLHRLPEHAPVWTRALELFRQKLKDIESEDVYG